MQRTYELKHLNNNTEMKKFIKVTELTESPLWINVDYIQAFEEDYDIHGNLITTLFMFVNSYEKERFIQETINVKEPPEEIMKLIQEV